MTLSSDILQRRLRRPFRYLESVGSSNDIAKSWLREAAPDGAVVIANEQRSGRGRMGRNWYTPPDVALAISVILRPPACAISRVGLAAALAVYDLAEAIGCDELGIKWPNDVLASGMKIGGILPEVLWEQNKARGLILGIGVNVRMDFSETALRDRAISLESLAGRRLDRADLLISLLQYLDYWYARIDDEMLFASWKNRLDTLGKRVNVNDTVGIAQDVDPDGSLLVLDDDGRVQRVQAGDIFVVDESGASV